MPIDWSNPDVFKLVTPPTPVAGHDEVDPDDELLSRRQVAQMLNVSIQSLADMAYHGRGPTYFRHVNGKRALYRKRDVEAWLVESQTEKQSDMAHAIPMVW